MGVYCKVVQLCIFLKLFRLFPTSAFLFSHSRCGPAAEDDAEEVRVDLVMTTAARVGQSTVMIGYFDKEDTPTMLYNGHLKF